MENGNNDVFEYSKLSKIYEYKYSKTKRLIKKAKKMDKKENYFNPKMAPIGEPYPGPKVEIDEDEISDEDFYRLSTDFLMTKILELYLYMDSPNFAKNQQHLAEEMELYIRNHKNDYYSI